MLDFYALTDHSAGDFSTENEFWEGLTSDEWRQNKNLVEKFNEPGKFIPFLGCEWSGRAPYGHRNVIYKNFDGQIWGENKYTSIENIWELISAGDAITIPHHLGIVWPGGSSPCVDWSLNRNDELRPSLEIYSIWGSSEFYKNSMSYEKYHQRNFSSYPGFNYARDAWTLGHWLGVVGGSDDHTSFAKNAPRF